MSVIVTGCLESDGTITFTEGACEYTAGCLVRGGVHDGQIKITIGESCCSSDTYYACIDKTTKKFKTTIPERCCEGIRSCGIGADSKCESNDIIPDRITLTVSRADSDCLLQFPSGSCKEIEHTVESISGEHELVFNACLDQDDFPSFGLDCGWVGRIAGGNEWDARFALNDCSGAATGSCDGADLICGPLGSPLDSAVFARLKVSGSGGSRNAVLDVHSWVKTNPTTWQACSSMYAHKVFISALPAGETIFDYFSTARASNTFGITRITLTGGSARLTVPADAVDFSAFPVGEEPC